jgi:hypothetical protein
MDISLSEDRAEASINLPSMTTPLKMSAEELSEFVRHLAWLRASMKPEMERVDLTPETPVSSVPAVRWQVTEDAVPGQFHLYLLHPGFGWLGIPMDRSNFDQMSAAARLFLQASTSKQ